EKESFVQTTVYDRRSIITNPFDLLVSIAFGLMLRRRERNGFDSDCFLKSDNISTSKAVSAEDWNRVVEYVQDLHRPVSPGSSLYLSHTTIICSDRIGTVQNRFT